MPPSRRAKQFAPFDALKGLKEAIARKERISTPRRILSEDAIAEINAQIGTMAGNAGCAAGVTAEVRNNSQQGNEKMAQMVAAMENIETSSKDISKIIKTIDEIAFQTNILSLNAAGSLFC